MATYLSHALSDDGRYVFFDTLDALVPQDINKQRDVYEYDTVTGQVHLISGGTCDCGSFFVDASPDGGNVFFTTHQELVQADIDTNSDLYDARIDGGIAKQNEAPPAPCVGDDCQPPASTAPAFSLPASSAFFGIGNPPAAQTETATPKQAKPKVHKPRSKSRHKRKHKSRHKSKHRAMRAKRAGAGSHMSSRVGR
jgi:hypothetical protein